LDRTRIATTADPALNQLRHYIFHGWPLQRHQLPEQPQHYWNYREELAVEDGVIFKAHRLVISPSLIAEYLKDLHAGHVGEEKTLLRARETVFWPGISDDVRNALKLSQKQAQRDDYDRTAKKLQDLQQFQSVLFQLDPKKPILQKAKVVQQPSESSPRRYEVQTESGARYFRNRRHIRSPIEIQPEELYQAP
ncbi:unnamed protein product, partial [Porites lobata]